MPLSFVTLTTASANNGQNTNNHTQSQVPSKTLVTLTNPPSKPVQQTTAPGQSSSTLVTAATVQHTPTVEQHTPTVEQHTPSVEQHTPAPQTQHTPTTVQQHIPTSAQQHSPTTFQLTQSSVDTQATPSTINVPNTLTPVTNTTAIPTTTMSKTAKPTTSMPTTKPTTIPTTTTEPPANSKYIYILFSRYVVHLHTLCFIPWKWYHLKNVHIWRCHVSSCCMQYEEFIECIFFFHF